MATREHKSACVIDTTAKRVYDALLNPAILVRWLPPRGATIKVERFEPEVGGRFRFVLTFGEYTGKSSAHDDVISGHFVRLIPEREVEQTISFVTAEARFRGKMRMRWRISDAPNGTDVSVSAEDVPVGIDQADHETGMKSSLENLKTLLERKNDGA